MNQRWPGVVLSPKGKRTVSREDRDVALAGGIGVIDCSWNALDNVPFNKLKSGADRLRTSIRRTRILYRRRLTSNVL